MKIRLTTAFCVIVCIAFAQNDTNKLQQNQANSKPSGKGIFISGGIGESTIGYEIYGVFGSDLTNPAKELSQSPVANAHVDYAFVRYISIGASIAYQTVTGAPYAQGLNSNYLEQISRLNIAGRILVYYYTISQVQLYGAFAIGLSTWTDNITPQPPPWPNNPVTLTMGSGYFQRISFQLVPIGIRVMQGHIGFNAELAVGTPYFVEGGVTFRIGKLK